MGRLVFVCGAVIVAALGFVATTPIQNSNVEKYDRYLPDLLQRAGGNKKEILGAWNAGARDEEIEALRFLLTNMPDHDLQTLTMDYIMQNVDLALQARNATAWARSVPWDIFLNNVLPYASLAEPRDPWREMFFKKWIEQAKQVSTIADAALLMNKVSWAIVDPPIIFVAAPPDELNSYSPFQTMRNHNASCTGLSIFLVDACRSIGVPARVAGVPHWNKPQCSSDMDPECGNHDWVEVFVEGGWAFVDQDTSNPLNSSWFYPGDTQFQVPNSLNHSIYASSWNHTQDNKFFPMVWDWEDHSVPGVDVTTFYTQKEDESVRRNIAMLQKAPASRDVKATKTEKLLASAVFSKPMVPF